MKVIRQELDLWGECPTTRNAAILWIERAGRTCYRSEDKIVEGSGEVFVNNIAKRKHLSVIEHSNIVLKTKVKPTFPYDSIAIIHRKLNSKFLDYEVCNGFVYIGGNYRAWMEALSCDNIDSMFNKLGNFNGYDIVTDHKDIPRTLKRITAKFITNRAVTHELVRQRLASFSQESQRYCAYLEDISFILPDHFAKMGPEYHIDPCYAIWEQGMAECEKRYKILLENYEGPLKKRAEKARDVLPNSTAAEIVVTAGLPEWEWIFSLRTPPAALPEMRSLMIPMVKKFIENKFIPGGLTW